MNALLWIGLSGLCGQAATSTSAAAPAPPWTLGAYVEAQYQWNFREPSNGITNFRGFDNRHNNFTLANVALDASWDVANVVGKLTLQVGHTPSTYYLAEPARPGASGANATGAELWKYIQQAYVGYRFDVGSPLLVTLGVFLSPIGPEGMAVRDNWNWSRSNLFFGLPFYHTGLRATYTLDSRWAITLAGLNGWNSVVDNNNEKSVMVQLTYTVPDALALSFLSFTGVERPEGAAEGRPWRQLFDAHATWTLTPSLSLLAHADGGFEPNTFGTSAWVAGALYARYQLVSWLYLAVRGDAFYEKVAAGASSIFWPTEWVASGTGTLDFRPAEKVSLRLEFRSDHASGPIYFGGAVDGDGVTTAYVPNRNSQQTLTLGVTAWI